MPAGRHRKTKPWTRRLQRVGAPAAAALAVATAVPLAAVSSATEDEPLTTVNAATGPAPEVERAYMRALSRSRDRVAPPTPAPTVEAVPVRLRPRWTTVRLNVRSKPNEGAKLLTVLDRAVKIQVTGEVTGAWAQIRHKQRMAWVHKEYLAREKPKPLRTAAAAATGGSRPTGVSGAPCPDGSAVESGLTSNAIKLYRAVCAAFPEVSSWGGRSGSGDHGAGRALDIMCTGSLGDRIADYVRANAGRLGVSEVIWAQRIWTVQRSSEGWRPMEDRGSSTANHYDHVHVSVY